MARRCSQHCPCRKADRVTALEDAARSLVMLISKRDPFGRSNRYSVKRWVAAIERLRALSGREGV